MGNIKHILVLDIESFYDKEVSLRHLSVPEYIWHPKFQTHLLAAYELSWPAPRIILPPDIPAFLATYDPAKTLSVSHNALFDASVLSWRYGWVPRRMQCTLAMARALRAYKHNSLGAVAKELFGHDPKGDVIRKVAGLTVAGIKQAGLWPDYCTYALKDTLICSQIFCKLYPELPVEERLVLDLVLRCAVTPVLHADVPLLDSHLDSLRRHKAALLRDCGYDKAALMSTTKFQHLLERLGVPVAHKTSAAGRSIPAFARTDPFMTELTEYEAADEETNWQVQALAAARLSHRSTIEETRVERFGNIARLPWKDGPLLPVALRYGGAHTGRLSGEWRLNMQNLPRDKTKSKLRAALCAPPGYLLITADLAQIEARIVACMCRQDGLTVAFRNNEDVYATFAGVLFGRTITKINNPHERFIGKTAILGLGYGCGHERFYQMVVTQARANDIPLEGLFDERSAQTTVETYRTLFNRIPLAWRQLDRLLATVINNRNTQNAIWGPVIFKTAKIVLPNGMNLRYEIGDKNLYGAKLLENITQALARIIIMSAAVRLAKRGLRFVLQSHDELVFIVRNEQVESAKPTIMEEMTQSPEWLPDLPLAVELGVGLNYGTCR